MLRSKLVKLNATSKKAPAEKTAAKPAAKKKASAAPAAVQEKPSAKSAAKKAPAPKTSAKAVEPKVGKVVKVAKDASDTIVQLATDVLEDRIVPTIEQIKSLATSAIGHGAKKSAKAGKPGKKAKSKK